MHIDWSEVDPDKVDFSCPFCHGTEKLEFEDWKERFLTSKVVRKWVDEKYKEYRADCLLDNTEPLEFYDWLPEFYEDAGVEDDDSLRCEECESGYIYPVMNYVYRVYVNVSDETKKIAIDCGLFLFEWEDGETYMSLTGGGMDLSPNILLAYLRLTDHIPIEWAMEFRQDYRANLTKEQHREIAAACRKSAENAIYTLQEKLNAINLFIDHPDILKQRLKERNDAFNASLETLSEINDPAIRTVGALAALSRACGDVTA